MPKILFVCNGNIFRSLSAEYCLKQYIKKHKINWEVGSAGMTARKQNIDPALKKELEKRKIDPSKHIQRKVTARLLKQYDVIVAMAEDQIINLRKKFNCKAHLFNEIAYNKRTSIWDIGDEVPNFQKNRPGVIKKIKNTVRHIHTATPKLAKKIEKNFFLFQDFITKKKHRNNFPFIILYETKNILSFMSISIPKKEDGHILVIPKKRYETLDELPKSIAREFITTIQYISKKIKQKYGAYNVIINNGEEAQQSIFHVHAHIIPRQNNDDIKIELWHQKKMTKKEFIKENMNFKKLLNK